MTSPNPPQTQSGQPYIPGLITAGGQVQQALPTAAQPGSVPGQISADGQASQLAQNVQQQYAQPQQVQPHAPDTATVPAVPAGNVAVTPGVNPPVAPVLPTAIPGYPAAPAVPGLQPPPAVPGLNPPAPQQPAAPADPAPQQQPPAPASAPPAPASPDQPGTGGEDRGYPQGTPLEQMTGEQREAYWKYHARQWENRAKERSDYDDLKAKATQYDQLAAQNATEQEKAIAAARQAGFQEAAGRAAIVLVDAHVRAGLQQRLGPEQVEALAANLNHRHFLAADGMTVDAAKVATFVDTVAPAAAPAPAATAPAAPAAPGALPTGVPGAVPAQPATGLPRALPDLGQGAGNTAPIDKLAAGREQARRFLAGQL